jgi:hypothetical protein
VSAAKEPNVAEPLSLSLKLVQTAIVFVPRAGRWLFHTRDEHVEFSRLLEVALANAVCSDDPDNPKIKGDLIPAINQGLNSCLPSWPHKFGRRIVHEFTGGRLRRVPEQMPPDGPSLFEHIQNWISRAFDQPWPAEALGGITCPSGEAPDIATVVNRLPEKLDDLLTAPPVTEFRDRLIKLMEGWRQRRFELDKWRHRSKLRFAVFTVGPTAATFAALEATWGNHVGSTSLATLVALTSSGLYTWARERSAFGLEYRAARFVTKMHEEVERRGRGGRPPAKFRQELDTLLGQARSEKEEELTRALEQLDASFEHWAAKPSNLEARRDTAHALAAVADAVLGPR